MKKIVLFVMTLAIISTSFVNVYSHWSVTLTNNVSDTMPGMGDII